METVLQKLIELFADETGNKSALHVELESAFKPLCEELQD
jgi:hypothetical protein